MRRATVLVLIIILLAAAAVLPVASTQAQGIPPPGQAQGIPPPGKDWTQVLKVENELTLNDPLDKVPAGRDLSEHPDTPRGQRWQFRCHCKVHPFKMVVGRIYRIGLLSLTPTKRRGLPGGPQGQNWDNFLRLEDPSGKHLIEHDDINPGINLNALIEKFECPRTGTYRIIVTSFDNEEMGKYRLTVWQYGSDGTGPKLDLSRGEDLRDDTLPGPDDKTIDIDKARPFSVRKVYTVKLIAGKTYQIDMMSKDFDAYLRLQDAKENDLASDDNSGGGLDARITFKCLRTGEYRIIASSALGGKGAYTLTVQQK
jgi:hypothetical protein